MLFVPALGGDGGRTVICRIGVPPLTVLMIRVPYQRGSTHRGIARQVGSGGEIGISAFEAQLLQFGGEKPSLQSRVTSAMIAVNEIKYYRDDSDDDGEEETQPSRSQGEAFKRKFKDTENAVDGEKMDRTYKYD